MQYTFILIPLTAGLFFILEIRVLAFLDSFRCMLCGDSILPNNCGLVRSFMGRY